MTQAVNVIQSFRSGVAGLLPASVIVSSDANGLAIVATLPSLFYLGVSDVDVTTATSQAVDVIMLGVCDLKIAAVLPSGTALTANGNGHGVAAVSTNRVVGILMESSVVGQICKVLVSPSVF